MSSVEGLRSVTMDQVPIDIQLQNIPKPVRIVGFYINKNTNCITVQEDKKIFTPFTSESNDKQKVE